MSWQKETNTVLSEDQIEDPDYDQFKTWKDCVKHDQFSMFSAGQLCDNCGLMRYCGRCGWDSMQEVREHDCDAIAKALDEPVVLFDLINDVEVWRVDTTLAELISANNADEGFEAEMMSFAEDADATEYRIAGWTGGIVIVRRHGPASVAEASKPC